MLYISWVGFPLHHHQSLRLSLSWSPLIFSNDQEENSVAEEKNPLLQLQRPRDHLTFGIPFRWNQVCQTLFPFYLDKKAIACMRSYLE